MIWPDEIPTLRAGRAHEVTSAVVTSAAAPAGDPACAAARAFIALQAAARRGPVVWILPPAPRTRPDPYGLARFFDPGRLILVETRRPVDVFWAMEESLRSGAAPLVAAETRAPADLTASRRLQLAAEAGGATGLLMIPPAADGRLRPSAAETRWRCAPLPARADGAVWRWECLKNKRGPTGRWTVRWAVRWRAPEQEARHGRTGGLAVVSQTGGGARSAA